MNDRHYDVIIIGTGAGGGTLAHRLAGAGKRVLLLERGGFLPREKANWDTVEVFQKDRYHTKEVWFDKDGSPIHPGTGYWVGGNTKVYGAALLRLRERDFEAVRHPEGVSPAWPLSYADFAPYYDQAEALYEVHGSTGVDPTDPPRNGYPHPPVSHEPRIQQIHDQLRAAGHHPFYLPLGVRLDEADRMASTCIRCDTCDGFPCLVDAKADSDTACVRPALRQGVSLVTHAHVQRLTTDASGRVVTGVDALVGPTNGNGTGPRPEPVTFRGDLVVVACGAINSAVLLLRSANDRHPRGLANGSDQVGRNFMKHHNGAILGISREKNPTQFQKTLGCNDFYWGEPGFDFPMGHVQLLGKVNKDMLAADAPAFAPGMALEVMAEHAVAWWLTAEDLPYADNRVRLDGERIVLEVHDRSTVGFDRLLARWQQVLRGIDSNHSFVPHGLYFRKKIPLAAVGHQCGTTRFGTDPATSVLDASCKAHELDNLYVVDGGFFPSSAAVNPSLTIMANALRVGDLIRERLG